MARQRAGADPARLRGRRGRAVGHRRRRRGGLRPLRPAAGRRRPAAAPRAALQRRPRARGDRRAAPPLEGARVLERTGAGVTQQSVGPKLRWLQRHEPDVWARTRRVAGSYDWLAGRLAETRFSERNWALESGLYDLATGDYAPDLCAAAGVECGLFGPVRDPADVIGGVSAAVAARTGLRAGIPVVAGLADHVSSAFGAGLARPGDLLVKLGGSVDVLACSDRPLLDARLYLDAHPSPGLWLPNGCMASGGSGVRWFQRELAAGETLTALDAEGRGDASRRRRHRDAALPAGREDPAQRPPRARRPRGPAARPHARAPVPRRPRELRLRRAAPSRGAGRARRAARAGARHERRRLLGALEADRRGRDRPRARARRRPSGLGARRGLSPPAWGPARSADWSDVGRFVALAAPIVPRVAAAGVYGERYRAYRALYEAVKPAA